MYARIVFQFFYIILDIHLVCMLEYYMMFSFDFMFAMIYNITYL